MTGPSGERAVRRTDAPLEKQTGDADERTGADIGRSRTVDEQIRDPFVLEFLNLRNEYAESDLEDALIHQLEEFLLELAGDFTCVGR